MNSNKRKGMRHVITNLASSIAFGIFYGLITYLFEKKINWEDTIIISVLYFIFYNISTFISIKKENKKAKGEAFK